MSTQSKLKQRMADAVVTSYYKPWYKRTWARIIFVLAAILFLLSIYFVFLLVDHIRHVRQGEFYDPALNMWLTDEQRSAALKLTADILSDDDPWLGAEEPVVNVIAYESLACPFCRADQPTIKKMLADFGLVTRFTTKDYPTEGLHPGVFDAHLAAGCANEQGRYWEYRDILFANAEDGFTKAKLKLWAKELGLNIQQFDDCLDSEKYQQEIRQDYASGVELGVEGTPTYVINGNVIPGSISYELWEEIIGYIIKGDYN